MEPTPVSSPSEPRLGHEVARTTLYVYALPVSQRILLGLLATTLTGLIVVAGMLTPDPSGMGTHQQLGLPPCSTRWLFGFRCPGCGMTTSWSWMMKGNWIEAFRSNAGGGLFFLLAVWAIPIASYLTWKGHTSRGGWFSRYALIGTIMAGSVTFLEWLLRLFFE